jgi:hypothetical protein
MTIDEARAKARAMVEAFSAAEMPDMARGALAALRCFDDVDAGLGRPAHGQVRGAVLDLWASGATAQAIATRLGLSRDSVAAHLTRSRRLGDPRAVVRKPNGQAWARARWAARKEQQP